MTAPVPWATASDVEEITGITVTDAQLSQAQAQIELRVGRTASQTSTLRTSALVWLRLAVAYQAAWMTAQPDLYTRSEVDSVSQDGASVRWKPDGQMLAPLARRALKRLGWKGTRSSHVDSVFDRPLGITYPAAEGVGGVHDFADDLEPWRSL